MRKYSGAETQETEEDEEKAKDYYLCFVCPYCFVYAVVTVVKTLFSEFIWRRLFFVALGHYTVTLAITFAGIRWKTERKKKIAQFFSSVVSSFLHFIAWLVTFVLLVSQRNRWHTHTTYERMLPTKYAETRTLLPATPEQYKTIMSLLLNFEQRLWCDGDALSIFAFLSPSSYFASFSILVGGGVDDVFEKWNHRIYRCLIGESFADTKVTHE